MVNVEVDRDAPLFDRPVTVRCATTTTEHHQTLTVRILRGLRNHCEKLVHIEVTDDGNDPNFFLYILDIGEQDFHHLKRDQALLVDFPVFPAKLIELINLCIPDSTSTTTSTSTRASTRTVASGGALSFYASLDVATGVLSVVEANEFKQVAVGAPNDIHH